ncbi:LacI family DNA-binding transcriptional regulator [Coraliomargarita algicola]|uniref:LacI family DNA-binding transcriptional regulator n=1 Tax=Coraliomargarita algicola TaxID=3092156 RepID=A0ABZ0RM13_9BACT|nr:LacI family DNA-binding transcriptional regulator [Coraliomargarita sp. J2-16]WPJ97260.1 LacI family DNA-binding transcriptional regulator [Coraliomargarita sp. J2-16]
MKSPTIREIAKACGVNNSTVSRALSNKPLVSADTRERILAIAKDMGWKPNPLASAYLAHRRATRSPKYKAHIAYILARGDITKFSALPDYVKIHYTGAQKRAEALGYTLEIFWLHEINYNLKSLSRLLYDRGVPGAIFATQDFLNEKQLAEFNWDAFATAATAYDMLQPMLHRAAFYWPHAVRLALDNIERAGYKKIGLAIPESMDRRTDYALAATYHYAEKHSARAKRYDSYIFPDTHEGKTTLKNWISKKMPEVIIGTEEVWKSLKQLGLKVPNDIAFVSPQWSSVWPDVAGIDQDPALVGANTLDLVANQLLCNERGIPSKPQLLLSEGIWRNGRSLPQKSLTDDKFSTKG